MLDITFYFLISTEIGIYTLITPKVHHYSFSPESGILFYRVQVKDICTAGRIMAKKRQSFRSKKKIDKMLSRKGLRNTVEVFCVIYLNAEIVQYKVECSTFFIR
jgi:hypothetical protein